MPPSISGPRASLYLVALTGGIGSGKSTVGSMFAARGIPIIDADVAAHTITAPGGRALPDIVAIFGANMLDAHGAMDRAAMRKLVFDDPAARARLEAITHPMIRAEMEAGIAAAAGASYAILAVPLLFEAMSFRHRVQRTLVVDCSVAMQRARVQQRSNLGAAETDRIIASQVHRGIRLQLADDVICNSGGLDALEAQVAVLHKRYCREAHDASVA